jgi:hypothetical protein
MPPLAPGNRSRYAILYAWVSQVIHSPRDRLLSRRAILRRAAGAGAGAVAALSPAELALAEELRRTPH